eukprot:UN4486
MLQMLYEEGAEEVYVAGIALDYCVYNTAIQAAGRGFKTYVILDATKAVFPENNADTVASLQAKGVTIVTSCDVLR